MKIKCQNSNLIFSATAPNLFKNVSWYDGFRSGGIGNSDAITDYAGYFCNPLLVDVPSGSTSITLSWNAKTETSTIKILWFNNQGIQVADAENFVGSPSTLSIPSGATKIAIQGTNSTFAGGSADRKTIVGIAN